MYFFFFNLISLLNVECIKMISIFKLTKCMRPNIFLNNSFLMIGLPKRTFNGAILYMHTYKQIRLRNNIPLTVPKKNSFFLNICKYLAPAVRSYSSKFNQEGGKYLVKHDPVEKEFSLEIAGLGTARITFERQNELIILRHTEVPNKLGGRGIGKILVKVRRPS